MEFRFRLVPLAILAAVVLLGVKLGGMWSVLDAAPAAMAQAPAPAAAPTPATPAQTTPAPTRSTAAVPAPPAPAAATPSAAPAPDATAAALEAAPGSASAIDPQSMTPAEVELLQQLSERRAELDNRAADMSQREIMLQAAETRIDEKIAKLAALEKEIGGIVDKQSDEDAARVKSLVKIYETMKPHDAARIFEQLDMPVLLNVVEHMKERNAAPILASMDPARARAVTLGLAERRDARVKTAAAPQAPVKP
jgi:flagellar motility protein MotE (MotC chaperone)